MVVVSNPKREFQNVDNEALRAALSLLDNFASQETLESIQGYVTEGKLQKLFPQLFADEPTPELPSFEKLTLASTEKLSDEEFKGFLRRT